jgi:hypothetical protein
MNLKIWSELLSGFLAFALGFLPCVYFRLSLPAFAWYFHAHEILILIGCFVVSLILWPLVKIGLTDKIFLKRRRPISIDLGGIALYAKRGKVVMFCGFFMPGEEEKMRERISALGLSYRFSSLPLVVVKKEITEIIFASSETPSCELSVEHLRFASIADSDPLGFFLVHKSRTAAIKFLSAAASQALQAADEFVKITSHEEGSTANLKKIFLGKLNELLAGKYYQVDGDFEFLKITKF